MKYAVYKLVQRDSSASGLEIVLPIEFDATFENVFDRIKCIDAFAETYGLRALRRYLLIRIDDVDQSVVS